LKLFTLVLFMSIDEGMQATVSAHSSDMMRYATLASV